MAHKAPVCMFLALCLAGCGGSGAGPVVTAATPVAQADTLSDYATEYDRLYDASNLVVGTTAAQTPVSGTATYEGIAAISLLPESANGLVFGGEMTLDISFADNTLTGGIDNFIARGTILSNRQSMARAGSLEITNGVVLRGLGGTGFSADLNGDLEIYEDRIEDLSGTLEGAIGGTDAAFIRGEINVSFPFELPASDLTTSVQLDGGFVARAQ